jgi:hypothetical protein
MAPDARRVLAALQEPLGPSVRAIAARDLGLVGERPFADIAAEAYTHGLLAIGTRSGRGRDAKLSVHVRGSAVVDLADEDDIAVIV